MRLTDIFKFKLFDRTDKADLDVVNENFQNVETALNNCKQDLSNHKSSGDHDSRYYTEAEMDGKLSGKSDTTHNHDSRYLQKSAVINSNTVTEAGYALDARQANPNVSGSLGAQINSLNKTFTTQISELNTNFTQQITITGDFTSRWYVGHNIIGWGFVTVIPWSTKGRKIAISRIRAFTGAGWSTNLTISDIKTYEGCFIVICGSLSDMSAGTSYIAEVYGSVR